jgi:hypothetical protein
VERRRRGTDTAVLAGSACHVCGQPLPLTPHYVLVLSRTPHAHPRSFLCAPSHARTHTHTHTQTSSHKGMTPRGGRGETPSRQHHTMIYTYGLIKVCCEGPPHPPHHGTGQAHLPARRPRGRKVTKWSRSKSSVCAAHTSLNEKSHVPLWHGVRGCASSGVRVLDACRSEATISQSRGCHLFSTGNRKEGTCGHRCDLQLIDSSSWSCNTHSKTHSSP